MSKNLTFIKGKKYVSFEKRLKLGGKIRIVVSRNNENGLRLVCKILNLSFKKHFS